MSSGFGDRSCFARRLSRTGDAPDGLRHALLAALGPDDVIRLLIFGPSLQFSGKALPATLLSITERGWTLVAGKEGKPPRIDRCDFASTLLVTMTEILLYGTLRLEFAANGRADTVVIPFNTVREELYQEAARLLLDGAGHDHRFENAQDDGSCATLENLPLKFRTAIMGNLPEGRGIKALVHWPTTAGRGFRLLHRDLAPAGALALTDHQLLVVSEEAERSWRRADVSHEYGHVIAGCPLVRMAHLQISEQGSLGLLELSLLSHGVGRQLRVRFPAAMMADLSAFAGWVEKSPAFGRST